MGNRNQVVLIYRKPIKNQHSIELIFSELEVVDHYTLRGNYFKPLKVLKEILYLRKQYNRFHITGDIHWVHLFLIGKVVSHTYHDFNHYEQMTGFKKFIYFLFWIFIPMLFAYRLVYISPYTQSKCPLKFLSKHKEQVIPNTLRKGLENAKKTYNLDTVDKFKILAFNTGLNKNISTLITVLNSMNDLSFELHIVGGKSVWEVKNNIKVKYYQNLLDNELSNLYRLNDLLWFVSLKEGFGMPIIEAQAHSLPVLSSFGSSMNWVGGDGAYYIKNPFDINEIEKALKRLIESTELRGELVVSGLKNIQRFRNSEFVSAYMKLFDFDLSN